MSILVRVLIGAGAWALLAGVGLVFMASAAKGRQRVEGGRPEDRA